MVDDIRYAGGDRGCLLLHGFTGSPLEMVPLAEALAEDGLTVHIARLAGHGTSPEDLATTTWQDWIASAQRAYEILAGRCRTVAVGGLSMGGSLALHLAATSAAAMTATGVAATGMAATGVAATGVATGAKEPAAVIAMATPVRLRPLLHRLARAAHPVLPFAPVLLRVGPRHPDVMPYRASYPRIPLGVVGDLSSLLDQTRELLPSVRAPLLVAQGRWDWVIPGESADVIYSRVGSSVRRVVWLPHSSHLVTLDRDRDVLFDEVRGFLREHLRAG